MKNAARKTTAVVAAVAGMLLAHADDAQAQTTGYTRYSASYTVQNRATNGCGGFSYSSGIWKTWICAGEERVELRWANWPQHK